MVALPSELPTGFIEGRFLFVSQDQMDDGTDPDLTVVNGTVRIICSVKKPLQISSMKTVLVPLVFEASFDSQGYLIPKTTPPVVDGIIGKLERGVEVMASNSTLYNPTNFTYRVEFNIFENATGAKVAIDPIEGVFVPELTYDEVTGLPNNIVNLADVMPIPQNNGKYTTRGETGLSVVGVSAVDGALVFTISDGTVLDPVVMPTADLVTDSAVAQYIRTGAQTAGAIDEQVDERIAVEDLPGKVVAEVASYDIPGRVGTEIVNRIPEANTIAGTHLITDPVKAQASFVPYQTPTPTYDGTGVAVHPSVYYNPLGWNGYRYWMAMTPYANGDNQLENPSILASHDGDNWIVPPGLTNPVEPPPGQNPNYPGEGGYHSDPELTLSNDGTMYMFWRSMMNGKEQLFYRTTTDGINWSDRVTEWEFTSSIADYRIMSPSIVQLPDDSWVFYGVDIWPANDVPAQPKVVVRRTATALGTGWTAPEPVTITNKTVTVGGPGDPWHIDVQLVGGEWHMLMMDHGSGGGQYWPAISSDGMTFKAGPVIVENTPWAPRWYKGCFIPAIRDGMFGWDTWVGGSSFIAEGSIIGRTFIRFDRVAGDIRTVEGQISELENKAARATVIDDEFNRTGVDALLKAPGYDWEVTDGDFRVNDGVVGALTDNSNHRALFDTLSTSHSAYVDFAANPAVAKSMSIIAGAKDKSNHYRFGELAGGIRIEKIVSAGVERFIDCSAGANQPSGSRFGLTYDSSGMVKAYIDGKLVGTMDDTAAPIVGTKVGIQTSRNTCKFDNFTAQAEATMTEIRARVFTAETRLAEAETSMGMLLALNGLDPWVTADLFNRADTVTGLGSTPTNRPWTAAVGEWKITNSNAQPNTAANNIATLDLGISDHWFTATVVQSPSVMSQFWINARLSANDSFLRWGFLNGVFICQRVVAGVLTEIYRNATISTAVSPVELGIKCKGDQISLYYNKELKNTFTETTLLTGTRVGIQSPLPELKVSSVTVRKS